MKPRVQRKAEYNKLHALMETKTESEMLEGLRYLYRTDLFYLILYGLGRSDIDRDWLYDRCVEVQNNPNGYIDLWARTHYKSSIITFAKTIQDILSSHGDDPLAEWKGLELTSCILSHTNPIAVAFLSQIKYELETNVRLKFAFPDILYQEPQKEAPMWSLEKGIVVKRKSNPREATVEASGLVDGQPISKHFMLRIYDDVVTDRSVTTTEQIKKTTAAWELSLNLGTQDISLERYIGTRYHFNDTWAEIIKRNAAIPRIYPATDDGKLHGNPVLLSKEALMSIREKQGPYIFSCQQLLNPTADDLQGFKEDWVKTYLKVDHSQFNNYILVDSAGSKKRKDNDWTTMLVIGAGIDRKLYLVDAVRDRFNLTERTQCLFRLHDKYKPLDVGYEEYGLQADIEHIEYVQEEKNYRFNITPLGGSTPKEIRIRGLVPYFENKLIYLPASLPYRNYEGKLIDLIKYFIDEEYLAFPVSKWDDFIDCFARIADNDMKISYPVVEVRKTAPTQAEEDWNIIWGSSDEGQNVFYLDD